MRAEETVAPSTSAPLAERLSVGVRERRNWRQLVKFVIVGGSGYAANLLVFTLGVNVLELHHLIAASLAFVVAVSNNFWWNRFWTFRARSGHAGTQALRYFTVSIAAFVIAAALLELLVTGLGMHKVLAQAVSVGAATPLNFLGNKMWSFKRNDRPG
ncbi:MAG: GtrA family protein [Thermoleophilaceae bacterium]|nr:GtrA family protein [Thermoleophilaceae bacterium]